MDLADVSASGRDQRGRTSSDLVRAPAAPVAGGKALERGFERVNHIGGGGEKLLVLLAPAAKGDVIVRVFESALIPLGAHLLRQIAIRHVPRAILSLMAIAFKKVTLTPLQPFTASAPTSALA